MAVKRGDDARGLDNLLGVQRPESFDWGTLYRVIPIRSLPSRRKWYTGEEEKRAELVGMVFLREYRTGLRLKLKVVQDRRDNSVFCHFPSFKQNSLMGEIWSEEVCMDNALESKMLLKWATEIWLQAIIDGQGVLQYRSIRADKYEFHPTTSDGHLKENGYGRLPWSEHARSFREQGYRRSDHVAGSAPQGVAEEFSGPHHPQRYYSKNDGDMDDVLQESDGVQGVRETLDRNQWIQTRPEGNDQGGESESDGDGANQ